MFENKQEFDGLSTHSQASFFESIRVLKRPLSIVKDKHGKVLKSVKTVALRDIIKVELSDGLLDAKVEDIQ